MAKRLSANAPQPRSRITFPGYPTLAAASLYLCLSGGCSQDPDTNDLADTIVDAGRIAGATDAAFGAGARDTTPPKPDAAVPGPDDSTVPELGGGASMPFDAAVPDTTAPTPDTAPDLLIPTDATEAGQALPETSVPQLAGGISAPYDSGTNL